MKKRSRLISIGVSCTKFNNCAPHLVWIHQVQHIEADSFLRTLVFVGHKNMTVLRKTSKLARKMKRKEFWNESSATEQRQNVYKWLKRCLCLLGHLAHEDRKSTQGLLEEGICDLFFTNWPNIDQAPHRIYAPVAQVMACLISAAPQETQKELTKHRDGKRSLLGCFIQNLTLSQVVLNAICASRVQPSTGMAYVD